VIGYTTYYLTIKKEIMNIFVTNGKHNITDNSITIMSYYEAVELLYKLMIDHKIITLDTETNGLDTITADLLILAIKCGDYKFAFDCTNQSINYKTHIYDIVGCIIYDNILMVAHNAKYDINICYSETSLMISNIYDTMIAEQRIYQGFGRSVDNPMGITFRLGSDNPLDNDSLLNRYFNLTTKDIDKSVREDFPKMTKNSIFSDKHILYVLNDITYLETIRERQIKRIEQFQLQHILYNVEFPLISHLALIESTPFDFDVEKWRDNSNKNKLKRYEAEVKLDAEIIRLRDTICPKKNIKFFSNGKYTRKRIYQPGLINIGLFGEPINNKALYGVASKPKYNVGNVNYSSPLELLMIFAVLQQPAPLKTEGYAVPFYDGKKLNTSIFTMKKEAVELYNNERPDNQMETFINLLLEYRKWNHRINSFGEDWITKMVKPNNKVYTSYRQCSAVNGRFQSGDESIGKYNSQQIVADNDYRSCFKAREGYSIATIDLSGAEVTIMADKANDKDLYELAIVKDDVHSPVIQQAWRTVFLYRAGVNENLWNGVYEFIKGRKKSENLNKIKSSKNKLTIENYNLSLNFVVSKTENSKYRRRGKNLTFGGIYGAKAKRAGQTVGITKEEGSVYLWAMKQVLPVTYKYIEGNVEVAKQQNYIILNEYSKSRMWFPFAINAKKEKRDLEYYELKSIEGQARNIPISGTQADIIKEAIVEIGNYIKYNNLPCHIMLQVHDELVTQQPLDMDGHSDEWNNNPVYVNFLYDNGQIVKTSFPEFVRLTLCQVANRYLKNFKMGASKEVALTWIK